MSNDTINGELFFMLSTERMGDEQWGPLCVWWRPNGMGYTTSIGEAGRYTREQVLQHSDPPHHLAILCKAVDVPASRAKTFSKSALKLSRNAAAPCTHPVHQSDFVRNAGRDLHRCKAFARIGSLACRSRGRDRETS